MTRYVIALFSQSFPQRLPPLWQTVWRTMIERVMNGLLAIFFFVLPWFAISGWIDGEELPKALLGGIALSAWLVLRVLYAFLRSSSSDESSPERGRISSFSLWMGALGIAVLGAWVFSEARMLSWLGNGTQIGSSTFVLLLALSVVAATRDTVQRVPRMGRVLLRSWWVGGCIALFLGIFVHAAGESVVARIFSQTGSVDMLLFIPILLLTGLGLLVTRGAIEGPLNAKRLGYYQLSHAFAGLVILDLLTIGLLAELRLHWLIALVGSVALLALAMRVQKNFSLGKFLCIATIICSVIGLVQAFAKQALPASLQTLQSLTKLDAIHEILPSQQVSWMVVKETLTRAPFFGAGPGSWMYAFDQVRPQALNQTVFWDIPFPRSASAVTTLLAEYGIVFGSLVGAFILLLIVGGFRAARRAVDPVVVVYVVLALATVLHALMRPMGVAHLLIVGLCAGLLASQVFVSSKKLFPWLEHVYVLRGAAVTSGVVAMVCAVLFVQRAAAAQLLGSSESYALPLARRLNHADDFTFAREAEFFFEKAKDALGRADLEQAKEFLDRADEAIRIARERNPKDAGHISRALELARVRAGFEESAEAQVLVLADALDARRPTDPSSPLARFEIHRARMAREARWIEQGQGREREEATIRGREARLAAEKALEEALRRKSDSIPARYAQAAWLAQTGSLDASIHSLESLARAHGGSPDVLLPLALLYRRNNAPEKAVLALESLAQQFPHIEEYRWQLSLALVQAERWEEATALLQRLVAGAPQNAVYQTQLREVLRKRAQTQVPQGRTIEPESTASSTLSISDLAR